MKRIVAAIAVFVFILLLTKIANLAGSSPMPGISFSLKAERVMQCTPSEITLVDVHDVQTHLTKDASWPPCSTYAPGDVLDFYLSRGEKTHFLQEEKTAWWRKEM